MKKKFKELRNQKANKKHSCDRSDNTLQIIFKIFCPYKNILKAIKTL
jgi:hypothetical protein